MRGAGLLVVVLTACTPVTTRPSFAPYPEALRLVVNAPPARVAAEAQAWLLAQGVVVQHASPRDAFLESGWHDAVDSTAPRMRVKIRVWADPDVPGKARVTAEAVYVPFTDPSREPRDLERPAPPGSAGHRLLERLVAALREKLGETKY